MKKTITVFLAFVFSPLAVAHNFDNSEETFVNVKVSETITVEEDGRYLLTFSQLNNCNADEWNITEAIDYDENVGKVRHALVLDSIVYRGMRPAVCRPGVYTASVVLDRVLAGQEFYLERKFPKSQAELVRPLPWNVVVEKLSDFPQPE